jgi:cell division protein FtsI/penicillin-binding protein 2
VIRPSDGHILALANTATNVNLAINAALPPGSTMKIITAAALFDHTSLTPSSPLKCMKTQAAGGQVFPNEADVPESANASMTEDFARSCNTAFVYGGYHYLVQNSQPSSVLHDEAAQVFGFGDWSIGGGVASTNPTVPQSPNGSDNAADFMGQGGDLVSPLVMASVAATVKNGTFHQPILLPDQPQTPASGSLSGRDAGFLRSMMHAVAYAPYGTGYPRLNDLSGVGAKTGTAEVTGGTDGWMTAYNGQIAVASVVQGGTSGVDSAGYVVRALLQATGS